MQQRNHTFANKIRKLVEKEGIPGISWAILAQLWCQLCQNLQIGSSKIKIQWLKTSLARNLVYNLLNSMSFFSFLKNIFKVLTHKLDREGQNSNLATSFDEKIEFSNRRTSLINGHKLVRIFWWNLESFL